MELMPMLMSGLSAFKVFFMLKIRKLLCHSILTQNQVHLSNTSLQMLLALYPLLSLSMTTTRTSRKLRSNVDKTNEKMNMVLARKTEDVKPLGSNITNSFRRAKSLQPAFHIHLVNSVLLC